MTVLARLMKKSTAPIDGLGHLLSHGQPESCDLCRFASEIRMLRDAVRWIAQTNHQAHHEEGSTVTCPRETCAYVRGVLG